MVTSYPAVETKTIVRIGAHLAEFTPLGWKTEDPETARFCNYARRHADVPMPWYPNHQRSEAELLLEVCRGEGMDAEIISIGGSDAIFTDPDNRNKIA
jgi:hypothetical protein